MEKLVLQGRVRVEGKVVRSPKKKLPVDIILEVRTVSGSCEYCRLLSHFQACSWSIPMDDGQRYS